MRRVYDEKFMVSLVPFKTNFFQQSFNHRQKNDLGLLLRQMWATFTGLGAIAIHTKDASSMTWSLVLKRDGRAFEVYRMEQIRILRAVLVWQQDLWRGYVMEIYDPQSALRMRVVGVH